MAIISAWMLTAVTAGADPGPAQTLLSAERMPKVAEVDQRFQSYNVEMAEVVGGRFWAPYPRPGAQARQENTQPSGGLALAANLFRQRPPADLGNPRLRALAKALGPVYIRVSGSWANTTYFHDADTPPPTKPPEGFQNVLTRKQLAGVVRFARAVDGRLVTSFAVSEGSRGPDGVWKPDEARKVLRFARKAGSPFHAAELINEPNLGSVSGLPKDYNAARFGRDLQVFRKFAREEAPGLLIVGPGSSGEERGGGMFAKLSISSESLLAAQPRAEFDVFSYHFYGARSQRCSKMSPGSDILPEQALGGEWLGRTDQALAFYKDLRDRYAPGRPIWLNETAQASCGGDRWAASFTDTFRYVDQMGRLAKQGVTAVFHNTLAASDYGLIDEATLSPRPNYWAAVLWRKTMGTTVLDAGEATRPNLRIYAHCLRGNRGGVAVLAINLDRAASASLNAGSRAEAYTLTSTDPLSDTVELNGRPLAMKGNRLPPIHPRIVEAGLVTLAPMSITYLALPGVRNPACR